jgi:DNA-binding NarL/FixJ family response regulator
MTDEGQIRILIVDDNELVGPSLARSCEGPDVTIVGIVQSAQAALDAVRSHHPDIVLMDYRLGPDDGVGVAEAVLGEVPDAKVLIVSGALTPAVREAALDAGCWGCLEKTMATGRELGQLVRRVYAGERI